MKSKRFLHQVFVIFVLLMALFPLTACKEEEQAKKLSFSATEFVSVTDRFSLKVPAGWRTEEVIPGADFIMANTETALERYHNGRPIESGNFVLNVGFLPLALLQEKELSHLGFQFETSPEVFLQSLLPLFRIGNEPASNVAGEVRLVSLSDGRDAGMLTFSGEAREGVVLVFEAGDGVIAFVSALGFPAGVMGAPQEWGTIAEGKRADLVLLGANPLENISNTREIEGVMVRGQWLPRETLQGMLDDLASKYEVPKIVQLIVASMLALGALVYTGFGLQGIRNGQRRLGWEFSWGKVGRIVLLGLILAVWWTFWHTDIVLSHILGRLPDKAVTVRMLIPWPTTFIWISWAVTLWLLALITITFAPKAIAQVRL